MGRPARYIPENTNGVLVEISYRCIGGKALLTPAPNPYKFNELVAGIMGRALEVSRGSVSGGGIRTGGLEGRTGGLEGRSPLDLCSAIVAGNHLHLLCVVHEQQDLTRFMAHFGCNLSKEIGRLRGWRGAMWERRYDAIVVSPEAEWGRLKYSLSHGVKEELVERVADWPGIHAARQLIAGKPLEGTWFNRSKEWAARNRRQEYGTYDYATHYAIHFAQLPSLRHLTPEEYREKVTGLIREIEEEGETKRDGNPVAGVEKILAQNPFEPPTRVTKRSTKPLFHVASREEREDFLAGFAAFQSQFQIASEALRRGNLKAAGWFPEGSYPPALPCKGPPPPARPPWPPTRRIRKLDSGTVELGEIPVVEMWPVVEPRARGQPP